uniref:Uncharacterized protein n=1 Tax=Aegilops tauschii subsp. strangulata TaxID=200361 RepID=A0A453E386_AEGTS
MYNESYFSVYVFLSTRSGRPYSPLPWRRRWPRRTRAELVQLCAVRVVSTDMDGCEMRVCECLTECVLLPSGAEPASPWPNAGVRVGLAHTTCLVKCLNHWAIQCPCVGKKQKGSGSRARRPGGG